jgi:hypothetical protein
VLDVCLPAEIGWVEARVARVHDQVEDVGARWGLALGDMEPAVRGAWARHVFTEAKRLGYQRRLNPGSLALRHPRSCAPPAAA